MSSKSSVTNQTLDRGLRALEYIAESGDAPSIDELAIALGLHRSITYRLVRTLEDHGLTTRDAAGNCHPAHRLTVLARGVDSSVQAAARPEIERLADALGLTSFLAVAAGGDAITIDSAEPMRADTVIGYRPGTRHRLDSGAPGLALLAGGPSLEGERAEVIEARRRGWAQSTGEVVAGLGSLSTWVPGPDGAPVAAVACLFLGDAPPSRDSAVDELRRSARRIGERLASERS
jgi:DNA-binding IclR family transcriptional regulator